MGLSQKLWFTNVLIDKRFGLVYKKETPFLVCVGITLTVSVGT